MNRRQFFKRIAATCAGVVVAVVAPAVLVKGKPLPFKLNLMQQEILRKIAKRRKIAYGALIRELETNLFAAGRCYCPRN